jgi:4-hydroxybenzoate polyprenyltransferase
VAGFYVAALLLWAAALWLQLGDPLAVLALLPLALHFLWQCRELGRGLADTGPTTALRLFRANRMSGLLLFAACAVVGLA